jgi:iron complex transport system permease protein
MTRVSRIPRLSLLALLLLLACAGALFTGPAKTTELVLWQLRLPRVLLGALVGMALATAGTLYQGLLRNPLADPYFLGTSSGASIGIVLAGALHWRSPFGLYGLAFLGALSSVALVYQIAKTNGRIPIQTLVLAGVLVSTFINALVFLLFSLFYRQSFMTLFFLLGTLTAGDPILLKISGVLIPLTVLAAWYFSRDLNALALGEEEAEHLGVDPEKLKRILFSLASVLVAAAVAVSGMIGFVGLMVPHIVRLIVGTDHRRLIPGAALGGALLMVVMDTVARTAAAPTEVPVGVVAALLGTPFFIYLLKRKRGESF